MAASNKSHLFFASILLSLFFPTLPVLSQTESEGRRFDYRGDMLVRGFYLNRDLPLNRQTETPCRSADEYMSYLYPSLFAHTTSTPCRETSDYYQARLRLDFSFRPSSYADVVYMIEIGDITFGRDAAGSTGAGSGGKGNAVNIETRQMFLHLHNPHDTASLDIGIFPIGTPKGLVLASNGAGFRSHIETKQSIFSFAYLRKEDTTIKDGDSNGFSDSNFRNVNLGVLQWEYTGLSWLKSDLYAVARRDDDPSDAGNDGNETSRMAWGGIFLSLNKGAFSFLIHGVWNHGTFERPFAYYPSLTERLSLMPQLKAVYDDALATGYPMRSRFETDAGAGQAEMEWRLSNRFAVKGAIAGASGRLGIEPNGDPVDYRRDQFRTAGTGFQFSDIAVDSSGGYSIFAGGNLTGVVARGAILKYIPHDSVELSAGYYSIHLYRTPVIDRNRYYQLYLDTNHPDTYLGDEWNGRITWNIFTDLTFTLKGAKFDAGNGYKILKDIEYGDDLYEYSFVLFQKF